MKGWCNIFRKRRRPTPNFKIPPVFNPLTGVYSDLQEPGTAAYGSVMQVAAEDTYDDYVVCRGFDPRIMKFIDYGNGGNGISVAKPFGLRGGVREFRVGELFPAFLPIQGIITYTSPSPADIQWRLGQNPGTTGSTEDGGQPSDLEDAINILYDHNGKAVNWMLIVSDTGSGNGLIYGDFVSLVELSEDDCPVTQPINAATILVTEPPCDNLALADQELTVWDPLGCVLDKTAEELDGARVVFSRGTIKNPYYDTAETIPDPENPEGPEIENPCYDPTRFWCVYTFIDRCCVAADTGA